MWKIFKKYKEVLDHSCPEQIQQKVLFSGFRVAERAARVPRGPAVSLLNLLPALPGRTDSISQPRLQASVAMWQICWCDENGCDGYHFQGWPVNFHMPSSSFPIHWLALLDAVLCARNKLYEELTHWKRPWCWEGLGAGGEGDDRGWDGWMASPTRWTWVWVNSGSWWWTGRLGVLWFMGSQRVGHDWATELNWC